MIAAQEFETLVNAHGVDRCNMENLLRESKGVTQKWKDHIVDNESGVNFSIDDDMKFRYMTEHGETKSSDISEFAF